MQKAMTIRRPRRSGPLISLVPMIDVLLILLVFFMVTSTYLNLDMIPAVRQQDDTAPQGAAPEAGRTLMIRLGQDGIATVRGRPITAAGLAGLIGETLAADPLAQIVVLPSGAATTQALISVMDAATQAGAVRLRVIRLEARE